LVTTWQAPSISSRDNFSKELLALTWPVISSRSTWPWSLLTSASLTPAILTRPKELETLIAVEAGTLRLKSTEKFSGGNHCGW